MDASKIVFLINDQVRLIRVSYEAQPADIQNVTAGYAPKFYNFKTLDQSIKVGDFVVVETGTRHGLTVCKVEEVDLDVDFDDGISLKWAFQRVDAVNMETIRSAEAEAIAAAKRAELKRKRAQLREGIFAEHSEMLSELALTTKTLPAE